MSQDIEQNLHQTADSSKASSGGPNQPSLTRSTTIMSIATAVSRVTGYLRIFVLAYALGATQTVIFRGVSVRIADSYNLSNSIPNMVFELVAGGILSSLFIPIFIEHMSGQTREEPLPGLGKDAAAVPKDAWAVASNITNIFLLTLLVVVGIGLGLSYYIVRAMAVRVSAESLTLAVFFFRIFVVQIVFYGLCAIFTGVLNSRRRFTAPAVAPIFNNLTVVATVVLGYLPLASRNPSLALTVLAVGTTLGVASMAIVQVPALIRIGFRYRFVLDFRHPAVKKFVVLGLPILGYVAANQVSTMVMFNLAFPIQGGVTAYSYAWQFFHLPYAIFAVSVATALFPELSQSHVEGDMVKFKTTLSLGIRTTGLVMIPAAVALYVLSRPIISLFLEHGRFDRNAVALTAPVLSFFAFGLFSYSIYMLITRVYYSLHDSVTPLMSNAVGVPIHIVLNILFVRALGVKGLGLGFALTFTFTSGLLLYLLRKRIGPLGGRRIAVSLVKFTTAALPMGVAVWFAVRGMTSVSLPTVISPRFTQQASELTAGLAVAAVTYLCISRLLRVDELSFLKRLVRRVVPADGQ